METVSLLPPGSQEPTGKPTAEIQKIVSDLDNVKNRLDFYGKSEMIKARRTNHPYQFGSQLERVFQAQHVSNAWLKMYELAHMFNLENLVDENGRLFTFCNAELPGSFILALNHYCDYKNITLDWVASSLMPKEGETMLPDSYELYSKHIGQWIMDSDMTGDVTRIQDQRQTPILVEQVLGRKPMLYTSDIGGALQGQYNDQENICLQLQYGQAVSALTTLAKGGTAILKHFTFATPLMQSLHIVLASVFEKFYVVKPLTSRASNSENYLVGVGYKGMDPVDLEKMINWLDGLRPEGTLVNPLEHEKFMNEMVKVAKTLYGNRQTVALQKLLDTLNGKPQRQIHSQYEKWLSENPISPLTKAL